MNEVVHLGARGVAPARPPAPLGKKLMAVVDALAEPRRDLMLAPPRWGWDEAAEAARVLSEYEARCAPAPAAVVDMWLARLLAARLKNAPPADSLVSFSRMVMIVSGDLPAAVWTDDSVARVVRSVDGGWWPSAHDLDTLLRPIGRRITAERDALRQVAASAATTPSEQDEPGPELPMAEFALRMREKHGYVMRGYGDDIPAEPKDAPPKAPERPKAPAQIARSAMLVRSLRQELRAKYEEEAANTDPSIAEHGRAALAKMDRAAGQT